MPARSRPWLVALIALAIAAPAPAHAAPGVPDPVPLPPRASPARHHLLYHDILVGTGAVIYLLSDTALKPSLAPSTCRWCSAPGFDLSVRDALKWDNTGRADTLSTVTGLFVAPFVSLALVVGSAWREGTFSQGVDDGLAIVEAGIATGLIDQVLKYTTGRERPFVHFADPGRPHDVDDDVSFFSGHTSFAFSMAVAAGTIATRRGYKLAPVVWGVGLTLSTAAGYLRIAADRHYLSDVVVGMAVGGAIGYLVPTWFHHHGKIEASVVPTPNGLAIVGTF